MTELQHDWTAPGKRKRRAWDHGGRTRQERGYGREWERLRKQVIERDKYLCQACLRATPQRVTQGREVDHKLAKANGGTDELDNLELLCGPCHRAKTARDNGRSVRNRASYGLDGWPLDD